MWLGMEMAPRCWPVFTLNSSSFFEFPAPKNAWGVFY
jgi:hypothetical protein